MQGSWPSQPSCAVRPGRGHHKPDGGRSQHCALVCARRPWPGFTLDYMAFMAAVSAFRVDYPIICMQLQIITKITIKRQHPVIRCFHELGPAGLMSDFHVVFPALTPLPWPLPAGRPSDPWALLSPGLASVRGSGTSPGGRHQCLCLLSPGGQTAFPHPYSKRGGTGSFRPPLLRKAPSGA